MGRTGNLPLVFPLAMALTCLSGPLVHAQILGTTSAPPAPAITQTSLTPNVSPNTTGQYVMMGLAGAITPEMTGTVLITISGTLYEPTGTGATSGVAYSVYWGTGGAPSSGVGVTGNCGATTCTSGGVVQKHENGATITAADLFVPFSISVVATGLLVGTAYWIDLAAESLGTASSQGFSTVSISATELP